MSMRGLASPIYQDNNLKDTQKTEFTKSGDNYWQSINISPEVTATNELCENDIRSQVFTVRRLMEECFRNGCTPISCVTFKGFCTGSSPGISLRQSLILFSVVATDSPRLAADWLLPSQICTQPNNTEICEVIILTCVWCGPTLNMQAYTSAGKIACN